VSLTVTRLNHNTKPVRRTLRYQLPLLSVMSFWFYVIMKKCSSWFLKRPLKSTRLKLQQLTWQRICIRGIWALFISGKYAMVRSVSYTCETKTKPLQNYFRFYTKEDMMTRAQSVTLLNKPSSSPRSLFVCLWVLCSVVLAVLTHFTVALKHEPCLMEIAFHSVTQRLHQ
jgi:hypothetical protein